MSETTDTRAKVFDILKGFSTAMLVSHGVDGAHHARPMQVAQVDEAEGQVSFLTGHGRLHQELQKEAPVLLVFQNENSAYLSVRGSASSRHDVARIQQLWKEPYKVWFPQGPTDPNIEVVTVDMLGAEYWDNRGMNKLEYLFEAAKAYMQGTTPDVGDRDHHAKTGL